MISSGHFHVLEKVIYSELCDEKILWDAKAPEHLENKLMKWERYIEFKKMKYHGQSH